MAVVTPSDRPKSVRDRCVIELFVALFVLSLCPFDISAGVGAFGKRTESDLFLFLLLTGDRPSHSLMVSLAAFISCTDGKLSSPFPSSEK